MVDRLPWENMERRRPIPLIETPGIESLTSSDPVLFELRSGC